MAERTCSVAWCERPRHARGFCNRHYEKWRCYGDPLVRRRFSAPERFFFYVGPATADECWVWRGSLTLGGYGQFHSKGASSNSAHRFAYQLMIGPIADGLVIDHLCRNRACVNPLHLEPVTQRQNVHRGVGVTAAHARKTHCKRGHEFTPENTYRRPDGGRQCRECAREWLRQHPTKEST